LRSSMCGDLENIFLLYFAADFDCQEHCMVERAFLPMGNVAGARVEFTNWVDEAKHEVFYGFP
jgi:hypothetical protein